MKIFVLIILVLSLTGCSANLGLVENKVYNENSLKNYTNLSDDMHMDKYINRQDAINIAYNVINKGFGVQLDRNSLDEYISLYELNSKFFWNISMSNKDLKVSNYVRISCENGEILEASTYKYSAEDEYIEDDESFTFEKCLSIIKPLTDTLEINVDEYEVNIVDNYRQIGVELLKDDIIKYGFRIDRGNGILVNYYKGE